MISVIIPAYNEAAVIGRTLQSVLKALQQEPGEILVVCNGCRDNTFDIASRFDAPVRVFNLEAGSKIAALNLGDREATHFPRFYLDADIELSANALREVSNLLRTGNIHAASPKMKCEMSAASWPVRSFYRTWLSRPYHAAGHVGSGFVGISQSGRDRFDEFPNIIADDEFVRRQFLPSERAIAHEANFTIRVPHDVHSLIKVKTRSRLGARQLSQRFPELASNVRPDHATKKYPAGRSEENGIRPGILDKAVYGALCLAIRSRANRQYREGSFSDWERDETSRA
ncbi:MAG: glycosyltransferase family 2 protein [Planctomycetota bacterium]